MSVLQLVDINNLILNLEKNSYVKMLKTKILKEDIQFSSLLQF